MRAPSGSRDAGPIRRRKLRLGLESCSHMPLVSGMRRMHNSGK